MMNSSAAMSVDDMLDRMAITDLILRERWARETKNTAVASACFHADARVEVSWFKGSGAEFVELGKRTPPQGMVNFDAMGPPLIWIKKGRALADTACAVHTVMLLHGIEVMNVSHTRLLWRARKVDGQWLIEGLRGIYIRDALAPTSPGQALQLDQEKLGGYRAAYRHLSYVLDAGGRTPRDDLPGVDRPDTVDALRAGERDWLAQA